MKKSILAAVVALALTLPTGTTFGQVEARQGVTTEPSVVNFDSPMILDLPLPDIQRVPPGSLLQLPKVRKYVCDRDVSLLNLTIAKNLKSRRQKDALLLVVTGALLVGDSYDRRADIGLRLKSGDRVLASQILRNISAEEERSTPFTLTLPVTNSVLQDAFAQLPAPTLELTLTVRDDS